jgi:hypothetical protein
MNKFEKKVTTSYWWKRDDGKDIPAEHVQDLEDCANDRINQLVTDGWMEGELCAELTHGENEISYSGWWKSVKE